MSEDATAKGIIISRGQLLKQLTSNDAEQVSGVDLFPEIKKIIQENLKHDDDLGEYIVISENLVLELLQKYPDKRAKLIQLINEEISNLQAQEQTPRELLNRNRAKMSDEQRENAEARVEKWKKRLDQMIQNLQGVLKFVDSLPELRDVERDIDVKETFSRLVRRV